MKQDNKLFMTVDREIFQYKVLSKEFGHNQVILFVKDIDYGFSGSIVVESYKICG
jgi:hypothetical protein